MFHPVSTLSDLLALDESDILCGYLDYRPVDLKPGENRGRAYWHGWMNRARDAGGRPGTAESARLAGEVVEWARAVRQ